MATYKIAGLLVQTLFSHANVESEFVCYLVPKTSVVDIVIRVCNQSEMALPSSILAIDDDEYKTTVIDGETCCFIYRRNLYIPYSRLSINPENKKATISICVGKIDEISMLPRKEIRFAVMHPFFHYLFSRRLFPLHSCGLTLGGRGIVISGASGSGKSTIGRILTARYGAEYLGEDINACSTDGRIFGMPFSRVNNNREAQVATVVFLGDKLTRMDWETLRSELLASEFALRGNRSCMETATCLAKCLTESARCYMISRLGLTKEETASIVYDLALGRKEL